jgi:hypothetical protein
MSSFSQDIDPATLRDGFELFKTEDGLPAWKVLDLIVEEAQGVGGNFGNE